MTAKKSAMPDKSVATGAKVLTRALDLLEIAGKRITKLARDGRKKVATATEHRSKAA